MKRLELLDNTTYLSNPKVCGSFAFLFRYTKHICYNIHDNASVLTKGIFILGMENIIIHSVLHLEPFDIIVSVLCNGF